ncbi:ribosomal protection-like ABC-F family protein [Caldisalinibacter kiritimatiensis]|uniref:Vitamin B12 ABC transporter, ATPase component BtuD n=1 Tax=Caldisalinibacter kiritimatiensis TaxID=1304284 RepID=R1ASL6_9FIRM|nr:ABC-F type ribosomal protection protein [Caldisalinibacter kiritimatiensis]EOC99661.1 Vitamin B12 ABC transporter, ATPase component BtuD [Caldisalinibacter kiritimatiensis]
MIEFNLNSIQKYYGANKVLDDINFEVNTGEKIGIVGVNGTGKTTIFKIISGREGYDGGILSIKKGSVIGYIDQIPDYPKSYSVMDVLKTAFKELFSIKKEMQNLEEKMSAVKESELEKIMKRYSNLQIKFENNGGYEIEEKLNRICTGLRFSEEFKKRKFDTLSGGEKTTVILGKTLLQSPDVLLLDEPTNHLDIESIEWLESFLQDYKGTVLIISHDRYFLDKVVQKIIEIEGGKAHVYNGNYSYYIEEKERRLLAQMQAYKNQQKKIKAMEEAIKRFRDWGSRADNEDMFKKAKNMEKRIEKMDKIDKPILEKNKIKLDFSTDNRTGKEVIYIQGLKKKFKDKVILEDVDLLVLKKEKVGLLGKNGSGKSTLLKIILKEYSIDEGEIKIGPSIKIGYLEQEVTFEDEEHTVLQAFRHVAPMIEGKARNILAKFLFCGEDVFKKVKTLSGGERTRLKLCQLMHQDINTLILDEPTNHLDIDSKEILEKALLEYDGTIVFVSHDRYFINKIAERIVEIEDKKLVNYKGNYDYYKREKGKQHTFNKQDYRSEKRKKKKKLSDKNQKIRTHYNKKVSNLEKEIKEVEKLLKAKDNQMLQHATDYDKLQRLHKEKEQIQHKLDSLLEQWVELNEKMSKNKK